MSDALEPLRPLSPRFWVAWLVIFVSSALFLTAMAFLIWDHAAIAATQGTAGAGIFALGLLLLRLDRRWESAAGAGLDWWRHSTDLGHPTPWGSSDGIWLTTFMLLVFTMGLGISLVAAGIVWPVFLAQALTIVIGVTRLVSHQQRRWHDAHRTSGLRPQQ